MSEKPECREVGGSPSAGQCRLCANSDHLGTLALVVSGNSNGLGALTLVVHVALDDLGGAGFALSATAAQWGARVRCGPMFSLMPKDRTYIEVK